MYLKKTVRSTALEKFLKQYLRDCWKNFRVVFENQWLSNLGEDSWKNSAQKVVEEVQKDFWNKFLRS